MKTLKNIQEMNERHKTYYKVQCPHCHEWLVIPRDELKYNEEDLVEREVESYRYKEVTNNHLTGLEAIRKKQMVPKDHETARFHIQCCNCGHIFDELAKNVHQNKCNLFGESGLLFQINEEEMLKVRKFVEKHSDCSEKHLNRPFYTAIGHQFTYSITPGGIGDIIEIKCNVCGEKEDITDTMSW